MGFKEKAMKYGKRSKNVRELSPEEATAPKKNKKSSFRTSVTKDDMTRLKDSAEEYMGKQVAKTQNREKSRETVATAKKDHNKYGPAAPGARKKVSPMVVQHKDFGKQTGPDNHFRGKANGKISVEKD